MVGLDNRLDMELWWLFGFWVLFAGGDLIGVMTTDDCGGN